MRLHAGLHKVRRAARAVLATAFGAVGVLHLTLPGPFLAITPEWVPSPETVIQVTGLCEMVGAAGLLISRLRRAAGIGLALYSVCVYPANLKHAFDQVAVGSIPIGWWYHGPRLAFQPVIVWWALWASAVAWPSRLHRSSNV
jgi:uncharacterized membrane protein